MEHSLQAYLKRQSSEVLEVVLKRLLTEKELDRGMILFVLEVLEERYCQDPDCCMVDIEQIWAEFQKNATRELG